MSFFGKIRFTAILFFIVATVAIAENDTKSGKLLIQLSGSEMMAFKIGDISAINVDGGERICVREGEEEHVLELEAVTHVGFVCGAIEESNVDDIQVPDKCQDNQDSKGWKIMSMDGYVLREGDGETIDFTGLVVGKIYLVSDGKEIYKLRLIK